jgi:hypothetical protein
LSDQQIIWTPQEGPQTALLQCPVFEIFYGGARGGGKTESSIGDWLQHSSMYGENAVGIFVRRSLTQLKDVIARTRVLFSKLGCTYNVQDKMWKMAGGARLYFVHLENDSDAELYQGWSLTRIYIEEATNFPLPDPIMKLKACLRSGSGVPLGMRLTGNPGGPGHKWVKARYIDPAPQGYKIIKDTYVQITHNDPVQIMVDGQLIATQLYGVFMVSGRTENGKQRLIKDNGEEIGVLEKEHPELVRERVFIPSRLSDNQLLLKNDPLYALNLRQSGSEALVKAWLNGDWSVIDGAFFSEFSYAKHVLGNDWKGKIPKSAHRFRAYDWGGAKPFCVGWYALSNGEWGLPDGALLKYREWYGASGPNKGLKMSTALQAEGILLRDKEDGVSGWNCVADGSIFNFNGGPTIAEDFSTRGVQWRRADKDRQQGWQQVRNRLLGKNERPLLYVLDECWATIEQFQTCQHEDLNSEDLDSDAEDHAMDETRYACMSRPLNKIVREEKKGEEIPPWSLKYSDLMKINREKVKAKQNKWG